MRRLLLATLGFILTTSLALAWSVDDWQQADDVLTFTDAQKALLRRISPEDAICKTEHNVIYCDGATEDGLFRTGIGAPPGQLRRHFFLFFEGPEFDKDQKVLTNAATKLGVRSEDLIYCIYGGITGSPVTYFTVGNSGISCVYQHTDEDKWRIQLVFRKLNDF